MSRKDIILLQMLICVCSIKVKDASNCKKYGDSKVKEHCKELTVKNGEVCYEWNGPNIHRVNDGWDAKITCEDGFRTIGPSDDTCKSIDKEWANSPHEPVCEPDKTSMKATTTTAGAMLESVSVTSDDDGSESVQIAIPIVVLTLMVLVGILFGILYCRRKRTTNAGTVKQHQKPATCEELNPSQDIAEYSQIDIANNVESEHGLIPDFSSTCDNEYDALHMNGNTNKNTNGHRNEILTSNDNDTYSHAVSTATVFKEDESDYSHLDERKRRRLHWNKETDNVYNTLAAHGQNIEVNDNEDKTADTYYDHTDTHRDKSAMIDHDTYAHVNNV